MQSAGGCCLVVGDRLYFYVSGRTGVPGTSFPGTCSTGLATLRRDGFASITRSLAGRHAARVDSRAGATADDATGAVFRARICSSTPTCEGELRVEVLDASGRVDRAVLGRSR